MGVEFTLQHSVIHPAAFALTLRCSPRNGPTAAVVWAVFALEFPGYDGTDVIAVPEHVGQRLD